MAAASRFAHVVWFADAVEPLLNDRRFVAWRVLARAYLVAPSVGPRVRGDGAVVGVLLRDERVGVLALDRLDPHAIEPWIASGSAKRGPSWGSAFESEVLFATREGRATLPASGELLALVDDVTRSAKLASLERSTLAALERATSEHIEVSSSIVVERRIEMGSGRDRSDALTASIRLGFALRRDATPHRLYGEELTDADLYDWTLRERELAWFPQPEALDALIADVLAGF